MSRPEASYDCIIVGSGIAGLYSAVELLRQVPRARVAVFEKYDEIGGRTHTFHGKGPDGEALQWEAGAGRISKSHELLLGLLRRYRLHWVPIGAEVSFKADAAAPLEPAHFEEGIPVTLAPLAGLPATDLARHTIRQLLTRVHGPARTEAILQRFPYRAEVETMRADVALHSFRGGDMGTHEGYGICVEGFSAIIEGLRKDLEKRGGAIFTGHELVEVEEGETRFKVRGGEATADAADATIIRAGQIILALPAAALGRLTAFRDWKTLRRIKMYPLLRVYGAWGPKGTGWLDELGAGRIVSPEPFRYLIGGNPAIGSVQISYTDSQDTEPWLETLAAKGEEGLGDEVLANLRRVLKANIPPPKVVKAHAWREGCSVWLPGDYDPAEESRRAVRPWPERWPEVWVCGESFSMRQGWAEGALEHAELMLRGVVPRLERAVRKK